MTLRLELTADEAERVQFAQERGIDVITLLRGLISGLPIDSADEPLPNAPSEVLKVIIRLKQITTRPFVFLGDANPATAQTYLFGFRAACWGFGLGTFRTLSLLTRSQLWEAKGYEADKEAIPQMQARGMCDRAIVDELFAVEIAYWKSTAESLQ